MSDIPEIPVPFAPKRNARLDNVIETLKDHMSFAKNSGEDKKLLKNRNISKIEKASASTNYSSIIPSKDSYLTNSYLMWQNSANVCWLDASMALLVHNKSLIQSINESSMAQISKIICNYYRAVSMLNNCSGSKDIGIRVMDAKDMLKTVQESTLKYLQPILKYKEGEPDSAFCSLLNLIVEDPSIKDIFHLEYTWVQVCQKCNTHQAKTYRKPIITLPRVENFQPSSPISLYQCLSCKALDQRMTLNFKTLPQCLLFHFESGAGKGELQCTSFKVDKRIYRLTGVMTHKKGRESNTNHFVTFIRDSCSDMWMECNDLCDDIMCFSVVPPCISLQDVYILMFEAMDGKGTVPNLSLDSEAYGLEEKASSECMDIPLIDLEDEAEEGKPGTCRNVASEYEESKNILGNVDLTEKDCEKGHNKDMIENSSLNGNDPRDVSCENANLLKTSESSLHNVQVIKKNKIEKVEKDFKYSSNRSNKQLIAMQRKTQTVLKSRKQKSVDDPIVEANSTRTDNDLQRKAIIMANVEKVIETVSKLGNYDVIDEQLKIYPDLSNNLNLSNEPPNISSIAQQGKAMSFSKNPKRKFMDGLQSEVSTKMEDVLQKNILSNTCTDKSFSDVPPKRIKYTRRNLKPAVEQQKESISETAKNKTSDYKDNDQNDKCPSSDSASSKVNDLMPSNSDRKKEALHGPECLCDGMKMAEDLVDIVVSNVLKNMFNFLGIKEKK